jgi:hypothetical protein
MLSILFPIETLAILEQPLKAYLPIDVTESGTFNSPVNAVHAVKAHAAIFFNPLLKMTEVIRLQL